MDEDHTPNVGVVYNQLKEAVTITFSPSASQEQRLLAYKFIEKTQEDPAIAIQVGFQLCDLSNDSPVRHLGLQLVENAIKYSWLKLCPDLKKFIKDRTTDLIIGGTRGISSEEVYIKDKISRLFVEMIKREWPQQWPSLLDELNQLAQKGPTQTELILLIFVRLSEDVATLKTLENASRCQDIQQALSENSSDIFTFFFSLLEEHYFKYNNGGPSVQEHCRIIQILLITLSSYVEWVRFNCLKLHLGKLCTGICRLFVDDNLKIQAAECLLQLSIRRNDVRESTYLTHLFAEIMLQSILHVATIHPDLPTQEVDYHLQKILVQVTTNIGQALLVNISKDDDFKLPAHMELFLKILLTFTQHPSPTINHATYPLWSNLFRRNIFSTDSSLQEVIPLLIDVCFQKLLRCDSPIDGDAALKYIQLDFSSNADYSSFFVKSRVEIWSTLKFAAIHKLDYFYNYFHKCFMECLSVPPTTTPICEDQFFQPNSAIAAAWDRMGVILEGVISKSPEIYLYQPMLQKNLELIHACAQYSCTDPVILTSVLNCLSGYSVFIEHSPELLPLLLERFFVACSFHIAGYSKWNRPRKVKHVRKHAVALIVKLAIMYPKLMLNYFDLIDKKIDELFEKSYHLTVLEKSTLDQARLILISHRKDLNVQSSDISKILQRTKEEWLSIKDCITSPAVLMESIGLTKEPPLPSDDDPCSKTRASLNYSLTMLNAVVRRSTLPPEVKKSLCNGDASVSSPGLAHLVPFIPSICFLLRSHNGLRTKEALGLLHPKFSKAYMISLPLKMEICRLQGKVNLNPTEFNDSDPLHKMQGFTLQLTEDLFTLLGNLGKLGSEYYKINQLSEYLIHSAFYNITQLSDFRLRIFIKLFLRPFIFMCPEECRLSVLLPLLNHLCPLMNDHLSGRWSHFREQVESGNYDPDTTDLDEMFEDACLRLLTREYITLVKDVLQADNNASQYSEPNEDVAINGGEDMQVDAKEANPSGDQIDKCKIGALGRAIILCDPICHSLVSTLLRSLSWMDSTVCRRTLVPMMLMLRGMMQDTPQHLNQDAIAQILTSIITGLHFHGQHSENLVEMSDFACTVYELFLPHFPSIRQILLQLPNVTEANVRELDDCIAKLQSENCNHKKLSRQKKTLFRKIINGIVGKSLSEAFKKEVDIQDLAPMFRIPRPKQVRLDEGSVDFNLDSLFEDCVKM